MKQDLELFRHEPRDFYSVDDMHKLDFMANTLYADRKPWTIIEYNHGVFLLSSYPESITIHYLEFCLNWIVPSLFSNVIEHDEDKDVNILYPYNADMSAINYVKVIDVLFADKYIISALYDKFLQVHSEVDAISTDKY